MMRFALSLILTELAMPSSRKILRRGCHLSLKWRAETEDAAGGCGCADGSAADSNHSEASGGQVAGANLELMEIDEAQESRNGFTISLLHLVYAGCDQRAMSALLSFIERTIGITFPAWPHLHLRPGRADMRRTSATDP